MKKPSPKPACRHRILGHRVRKDREKWAEVVRMGRLRTKQEWNERNRRSWWAHTPLHLGVDVGREKSFGVYSVHGEDVRSLVGIVIDGYDVLPARPRHVKLSLGALENGLLYEAKPEPIKADDGLGGLYSSEPAPEPDLEPIIRTRRGKVIRPAGSY